jgi:hypothetical protein
MEEATTSKQSSSGLEFKLHPVGPRSTPAPRARQDCLTAPPALRCATPRAATTPPARPTIPQLVLINISDHYTRTKANSGGQAQDVLGCLLGTQQGRTVEIVNSFEMVYTHGADGIVIDDRFLATKHEQCAWDVF